MNNVVSWGYHVSALWMYGQQGYAPDGKPDMAEVGWLKQPSRGCNAPTVYAAWRWPNTYPNTQGDQIFYGLTPAVGTNPWFKIEMQGDGAWHGYYGTQQILWMANRNSLAAPLAGSERFSPGTTSNGVYYPGGDDVWETAWTGLSRMSSNSLWGSYQNLAEANYAPYGWYMSTDGEFDPWKFDNTRVHTYKARNNGGAGWVRSRAVGYAESHVYSPDPPNYYYSGGDCTNFASKALNYAGISKDTDYTNYYRWWQTQNINGVWIDGYPWTIAHDFYTYFRYTRGHFSLTGFYVFGAGIPDDVNIAINNGDIVSFDFDFDGIIEHSSVVVCQYQNDYVNSCNGDLINYRNQTPNLNRKHIIWNLRSVQTSGQQQLTQAWTWSLDSALQ